MCETYPDTDPDESDNEVREDGTAMHWLAAEIYARRPTVVNMAAPNNRILHDELFDAVEVYIDFLNSHADAEWQIEQPVDTSCIYPNTSGTPDAWQYVPGLLRVADYKGGFRFVEVWGNLQLIIYAVSILNMLGVYDENTVIELTVVQPRAFHPDGDIRTWVTTRKELQSYVDELRSSAIDAMSDNPMCTPNPGCRDCPGRHSCVAFQNASYREIEFAYGATPHELEPRQLGEELTRINDAIALLEARKSGLDAQAESMLINGAIVPGWTLEHRLGRTRWRDGMEREAVIMGDMMGVNLRRPEMPITPTQAAKLIPKELIPFYSHRPAIGRKLTKQDPLLLKKLFSRNYKGK